MTTRQVDVAIIGAGTAGMGAYRTATKHTDNVVLIEGEQYGTTCARVGCMPSKLLIAAADAAHEIEKARGFGVHVDGNVRIDGREVMDRVRRERDRFVSFVIEAVEGWPGDNRIMSRAKFLDDHTLELEGGDRVVADRIVIATGSRPVYPKPFEAAGDRLIINDDVFDWNDLPGSVAVFGGGIIGLELGQALHRLGVRMRLFGKFGDVGPLSDPEVKQSALAAFQGEFPFDPDANVTNIERAGDGVAITFTDADGRETNEHFDYLLAATGRRANVDKLSVENTSIELDDKGIPLFDRYTMQAGDSHIFIAGDVTGDVPLLHEAADGGRIAGDNAGRYPDIRTGLRRAPLGIMFTDPNIATVGHSYRELDSLPCDYAIGQVDLGGQGRSRVMLKNHGLLRVYGEYGTGLFLGAEMVGPRMEHIAHLLAWAYQQRMTVSQMLDMPFYHPVIEEGLRSALRDLNAKLHIGPESPRRCLDCGPGG